MDRREFLAAAAAPLVLGVVPPAFARRSAALRFALVTADLESSIVAVGLPSGRIVPPLAHARRPAQHRVDRRHRRDRRSHQLGPVSLDRLSLSPSTRSEARSRRRATPRSPTTCASPMSPTRHARRWRSSTCVPAGSSGGSRSAARRGTSRSTCSVGGSGSCSAARAPRSRSSASTIRAGLG